MSRQKNMFDKGLPISTTTHKVQKMVGGASLPPDTKKPSRKPIRNNFAFWSFGTSVFSIIFFIASLFGFAMLFARFKDIFSRQALYMCIAGSMYLSWTILFLSLGICINGFYQRDQKYPLLITATVFASLIILVMSALSLNAPSGA